MQSPLRINILLLDADNPASLTSALQERFGFNVVTIADIDQVTEGTDHRNWDIIIFRPLPPENRVPIVIRKLLSKHVSIPIILLTNDETARVYPPPVTVLPNTISILQLATEIRNLVEENREDAIDRPFSLSQKTELIDAHNRLINRVRELDTLLGIGKSVTSLLDIDAILRKVVGEAVTLTRAEVGLLLLIDPTTDELYLRAEQNIGEAQARNFRIKTSDSIAGQVVESKRPIVLNRSAMNIKIKTGFTVKALINVPLLSGDEVIGVLGVNNHHKDETFDQNALRVIQALADWAAIAITNARLYQETERGYKSRQLIQEISASILSSLYVEEIPHKLIKHSTEILGAECGSLALLDYEAKELVFQLAYDGNGQEIIRMRNLRLPLGRGIIGAVAADGQPRIVTNVKENAQWYSEIDELTHFKTEEVLAVPLRTEGHIIGVVELLNKKDGDFAPDDQELLLAVASAAAIAIQNARQFQALQEAHRELREAQAQRIASEQWSILGRASAGLAHRIHNSTAIIPAAAQDLRDILKSVKLSAADRRDVEANLSRIERNTSYTLDLADTLLRRFHFKPDAANDINALIRKAIDQVELPNSVELIQNLSLELPPVEISNLLIDAIVELMTNALKAMAGKGTLTISSRREKDAIVIEVSDTGTGVSPERLEKIFNLFYTEDASGLGFGLWWVRTFLQQYRGDVEVQSKLGQGTTFTMHLPVPAAE